MGREHGTTTAPQPIAVANAMNCELYGADMLIGDESRDEDGIIVREWGCPECLHVQRQTIRPPVDWEPEF